MDKAVKALYDNAVELAHDAVDETRMGNYDSKIAKCRNKSKSFCWRMKDQKSRGIIDWDPATGIAKVAKPIGVIGCVGPTTNPVITGRIFDNGVLCTCEQNVICPREKADEMIAALKANGAYYIASQEDAEKLRQSAFPYGKLNKDYPGASVRKIAEMAGLEGVPEDAKVIVSCTKGYAENDVLAKEKLFPVLALFLYDEWEDAMEIARANLAMEGMRHSVVIHSHTKEHIEAVPNVINVSRYGVNQVGGTALGGAMDNGLNPTTTLGCGTWGNNSISENLWFTHLMNVSRISYRVPDMYIPSDEEIWAD